VNPHRSPADSDRGRRIRSRTGALAAKTAPGAQTRELARAGATSVTPILPSRTAFLGNCGQSERAGREQKASSYDRRVFPAGDMRDGLRSSRPTTGFDAEFAGFWDGIPAARTGSPVERASARFYNRSNQEQRSTSLGLRLIQHPRYDSSRDGQGFGKTVTRLPKTLQVIRSGRASPLRLTVV